MRAVSRPCTRTGLTALVGRDEELELLLRRWSKAKTGEGQMVLLSGGGRDWQSRVTAALLERLTSEPHTRLRYFCSPQHTDSALYPVIGQMERAAGLAHDDTPQKKLDKLDAVLAQTSTSTEDAALFAEMLSLPNDGRYPTLDLTSEQRRQSARLPSRVAASTTRRPERVAREPRPACPDRAKAAPCSLRRGVPRVEPHCVPSGKTSLEVIISLLGATPRLGSWSQPGRPKRIHGHGCEPTVGDEASIA